MARGKRYSIYDYWEENGIFRQNPANIDAVDISGQSAYKGPVEFPKMFYHPKGEEEIVVPASVEQTPWGPQKMNEQRSIKTAIASNAEEALALEADGWHDHPAKAIAVWNSLRAEGEGLKVVPTINSSAKIASQENQIEKLKAELEMMKKENAKLASAPSASAPSAPPLPSDPSAVAKAVAEAARKVSAARGL